MWVHGRALLGTMPVPRPIVAPMESPIARPMGRAHGTRQRKPQSKLMLSLAVGARPLCMTIRPRGATMPPVACRGQRCGVVMRRTVRRARIAYITSLSHILIRPWIAVPQANARDSSVSVGVIARNRHWVRRVRQAVAWYHREHMKTRPAWAGSAGFDSVSCRRSARSDNLGAATYDQCGGRTPAGQCAPPPEEDP